MLIAKNSKMKMVKIIDSVEEDIYTCPLCGEKLTRNFGILRQYFSHPMGKGENCEYKLKLMLKDNPTEFIESDLNILKDQYYNKEFTDVEVEMSDYISDEGYPLTKQQKDIIFSTEDRIKVSALAGSSKTTTLYYYAKERRNKKILYLVYNKSQQLEAQNTFGKLGNVEIRTVHSLGYAYVGRFYRNKLTFGYNAIDVMKDLGIKWENQELAVKVYEMFKNYMLSEFDNFEELETFKGDKNREVIISYCYRLWELKKDLKSNVKVEHDWYLKSFQLMKKSLDRKYDILLIDEVQDSSMLVFDIIRSSNVKNICMVGDIYQSIYLWRQSCNIMPLFKAKEYKLTTSFRVSQNIANIANMIVEDVNDTKIGMTGFNSKQTIVEKIDKKKPYAVLCRTNSSLFGETIDALNHGKKAIYYEGGYSGYNFNNILDCYNFSQGDKVKNPLFNKFKNYSKMEEFAEQNTDIELLSLMRMIDKYGMDVPDLIHKIKSSTTTKKEKLDVYFSTIHKSKGSTIEIPLLISDDHFDIEDYYDKKFLGIGTLDKTKDYYEEMCLIYVAITRAKASIVLSDTLKKYLVLRYKFNKNK